MLPRVREFYGLENLWEDATPADSTKVPTASKVSTAAKVPTTSKAPPRPRAAPRARAAR
jgi:hypothetical protein